MKPIFNPFTASFDYINPPGLTLVDVPIIVTDTKDNPDVDVLDTLGEHAFYGIEDVDNYFVVVDSWFVPDNTLTADNTDYGSIFVYSRDSMGVSQTIVASCTTEITGTGDWVAFVPEALTLNAGNLNLVPGTIVTWEITKSGGGVSMPSGSLVVRGYFSSVSV
jgi:hypothetical protein